MCEMINFVKRMLNELIQYQHEALFIYYTDIST